MASSYQTESHAKVYAKYRPVFPIKMFEEIVKFHDAENVEICSRDLAVDVGCGNGQCTLPLCAFFKNVIGCDISKAQINFANKDFPNVSYEVSSGEDMQFLENESTNVITVVSALHYLDLDKFYMEAKRVLKSGGVLAAASYYIFPIQQRELNDVIFEFYKGLLGPYWDKGIKQWEDQYRNIPSPFGNWTRIERDDFYVTIDVSVDDFVGFLESWHSWQRYLREHPGSQELEKLRKKLSAICCGKNIEIKWPVFLLMCRKPST